MKPSKSFLYYIISYSLLFLGFIAHFLWIRYKFILGLAMILSLGFSLAGLIIGIEEAKKEENTKAGIGIGGNQTILILFILIIMVALIKHR